jgi:superoxide reductase
MDRRDFLKTTAAGAGSVILAGGIAFAQEHFPVQVDEKLWQGINRVQNPENETALEKLHVPVITAPEKVKAGEIFNVKVSIGKNLHVMTPAHWIEYLQLSIGNEPAGTIMYNSHGYMKPENTFSIVLGDDMKGKTLSIVATIKCNLHGIWQHYVNITVE